MHHHNKDTITKVVRKGIQTFQRYSLDTSEEHSDECPNMILEGEGMSMNLASSYLCKIKDISHDHNFPSC